MIIPLVTALALLLSSWLSDAVVLAQELEPEPEPRRWSHLPIDADILGLGYARTEEDIKLDPVLRVENSQVGLDTWVLRYIHTFEILNRSARIQFTAPYQEGTKHVARSETP